MQVLKRNNTNPMKVVYFSLKDALKEISVRQLQIRPPLTDHTSWNNFHQTDCGHLALYLCDIRELHKNMREQRNRKSLVWIYRHLAWNINEDKTFPGSTSCRVENWRRREKMIKKDTVQSSAFQLNQEINVSLKKRILKKRNSIWKRTFFLFFSPSWGFRTIFTLRAEGKEENDIKLVH